MVNFTKPFCNDNKEIEESETRNLSDDIQQGRCQEVEESTHMLDNLNLEDNSYSDINIAYEGNNDDKIYEVGPFRVRQKGKKDSPTVEQVMPELIAGHFINNIGMCISTGKEAHVYLMSDAYLKKKVEIAIKVFKTSKSAFVYRTKYVDGDFRYQGLPFKDRNAKNVAMWAAKEFRNLIRLHSQGLNVPKPFLRRNHIIYMEFIGINSFAAPTLKNVKLTQSKACEIYREVVVMMWQMYNKAKLVHADLSEYNLLYFNHKVYVIDVSQAVEHGHPNALNLLRQDCNKINYFFKRNKVATMTVKQLFEFITDVSINEENMDECLEVLSERAGNNQELTPAEQVEEEAFKNILIPRSLNEIVDFEKDIRESKSGNRSDSAYKHLIGLKDDLSGIRQIPQMFKENYEETSSDDEDEEHSSTFRNAPKYISREERKARKKIVKQAQANKRQMRKSKKKINLSKNFI